MLSTPFYDPAKSYEENFTQGPFGAFADHKVLEQRESLLKASSAKGFGGSQYDFLGFKVNSPFGIPAGPLINGNFIKNQVSGILVGLRKFQV